MTRLECGSNADSLDTRGSNWNASSAIARNSAVDGYTYQLKIRISAQ
jgi:hypothetical protein